jgi:hypothetical protein
LRSPVEIVEVSGRLGFYREALVAFRDIGHHRNEMSGIDGFTEVYLITRRQSTMAVLAAGERRQRNCGNAPVFPRE